MNLPVIFFSASILDFPRASGDEPTRITAVQAQMEFSPREWG